MTPFQATAHLDRMYIQWELSSKEIIASKNGYIEAVFPVIDSQVDDKFFAYVCKTKRWPY